MKLLSNFITMTTLTAFVANTTFATQQQQTMVESRFANEIKKLSRMSGEEQYREVVKSQVKFDKLFNKVIKKLSKMDNEKQVAFVTTRIQKRLPRVLKKAGKQAEKAVSSELKTQKLEELVNLKTSTASFLGDLKGNSIQYGSTADYLRSIKAELDSQIIAKKAEGASRSIAFIGDILNVILWLSLIAALPVAIIGLAIGSTALAWAGLGVLGVGALVMIIFLINCEPSSEL